MAGESTMLWNPTPSDVYLFLKDVIYVCMIYIYKSPMTKQWNGQNDWSTCCYDAH